MPLLGSIGDRVDAALGESLEHLVVAHHRRRLRRIEWLAALDAFGEGWAEGDPTPRSGTDVEILVDGAQALPVIAEAIDGARSSVWITGWYLSPSFRLRPDDGQTLLELLAEKARQVDLRVLLWAGSPLPLFHPDRHDLRRIRDELRHAGIRCALDDRERPMHCHHEKLVLVDGSTAFVGGIDLTHYAGDRLDRNDHPRRADVGWHDAASRLRGPIVADVVAHFSMRWNEVTGEPLEDPEPPQEGGTIETQLVRTVPEKIYRALPRGDFRILESYGRALRSAQSLVYLESQFLWSPEIVEILAEKLRSPPVDEFRVVVLLPAKPNNGEEDSRGQLALLEDADRGNGRFLACTLSQKGPGQARPVYVHAKIGIVDDRWLTLGSANLNEHSLFNDTEVNIVVRENPLVRETRLRLWSEHLECDPAELDLPPHDVVDNLWRPLADEQLERRKRREPQTRRLVRLPASSKRSARIFGPISGFLVDG